MRHFIYQRAVSKEWKDNQQNGKKKCLQFIYLIRLLYPEHAKNSDNLKKKDSELKKQPVELFLSHFPMEDVKNG